jgi:hypothetical protein
LRAAAKSTPAEAILTPAEAIIAAPAGPPTPVSAIATPPTSIADSKGWALTIRPTVCAPATVAEAAVDTALPTAFAALLTVEVIESNNPAGTGPPICKGGST